MRRVGIVYPFHSMMDAISFLMHLWKLQALKGEAWVTLRQERLKMGLLLIPTRPPLIPALCTSEFCMRYNVEKDKKLHQVNFTMHSLLFTFKYPSPLFSCRAGRRGCLLFSGINLLLIVPCSMPSKPLLHL